MSKMRELLGLCPVMPVVTLEDPDTAVPVAEALCEAGLPVIELMLRTPRAIDVIRAIARAVPKMQIGAGTVLDGKQLKAAVDAGARFIVSPGLTPALLAAAERARVPFLPGIASASELMLALEAGVSDCKLFPASVLGVSLLKALAGPFPGVRFCTTGGISRTNMREFLAQENVLTVGCSWIAPAATVSARDWKTIGANAVEALGLARS